MFHQREVADIRIKERSFTAAIYRLRSQTLQQVILYGIKNVKDYKINKV